MARISLKYRVEYVVLVTLAVLVRALPRRAAIGLGRTLGRWSKAFLPGRYRLAKDNMSRALPELSAAQIEENLRKNFEHIGISGVEMLRLDMFKPGSRDLEKFFSLGDLSPVPEALKLNRGVIILTGHLGFWEVGQFLFPELGIPFDVVAKPLKNPLTDRYFNRLRKTYGVEVLESRKGARRIIKSLQQQHAVGILLDQHISPPGSVAVDFFGRKAYTTTAITSLAMKYQVPVVPVFCLRQPDDRYRVWAEPMLLLDNPGDDAVAANTQLLTDQIEAAIRKDVSQWFWMHKRWRVKD
ncbi:MAG: lysophospholipid acyltransferase family protein [Desulfuromonadales bacterium]|nr:lysophospholipid acyltransferase family protein [Desulfuromonadales bacterium]MBN2792812.1 lysophospholipid acyltransferase family protein [Desulfuromonadales bacterium]